MNNMSSIYTRVWVLKVSVKCRGEALTSSPSKLVSSRDKNKRIEEGEMKTLEESSCSCQSKIQDDLETFGTTS